MARFKEKVKRKKVILLDENGDHYRIEVYKDKNIYPFLVKKNKKFFKAGKMSKEEYKELNKEFSGKVNVT